MDSESELIFKRMQLHRMMLHSPLWSQAMYAAALGMSEKWVQKWMRRFRTSAASDFTRYLSHSRAPKRPWRETEARVKEIIIELRLKLSKHFHRPAGPKLIR